MAVGIRGLRFAYPDGHRALGGLDLDIADGQRVALLGPNGAGKTTLALHLVGVHRAEAGSIHVDGVELADATLPEIRRRVGLVFQDAGDQLFMPTVAEDVAFGPANAGIRAPELGRVVTRALTAVGAGHLAGRAPHHLSGGERRRVAIATVLAMDPAVIVLDEPTSGLDPSAHRELVGVLSGLPQTLVVITHDLPFALELCPRAVVLSDGRVVADGPTGEILGDDDLLDAHGLALPYAFDRAYLRGGPGSGRGAGVRDGRDAVSRGARARRWSG